MIQATSNSFSFFFFFFFLVLWFIKPHAHVCQGLNTLPDTRGHSANVRRDSSDFRRKPGALLPSSPSPAEAGRLLLRGLAACFLGLWEVMLSCKKFYCAAGDVTRRATETSHGERLRLQEDK